MASKWTESETTLLGANLDLSTAQLAELLGRSVKSVEKKRSMIGGFRAEVSCEICGGVFHSTHPHMKYCSDDCRRSAAISRSLEYQRSTVYGRYNTYVQGAKARGYSFDLTKEEFESLWRQPCSYCGGDIETVGIDRVDNNLGYTLSNCVPCCSMCNRMKGDMDAKSFLSHIGKINGHLRS